CSPLVHSVPDSATAETAVAGSGNGICCATVRPDRPVCASAIAAWPAPLQFQAGCLMPAAPVVPVADPGWDHCPVVPAPAGSGSGFRPVPALVVPVPADPVAVAADPAVAVPGFADPAALADPVAAVDPAVAAGRPDYSPGFPALPVRAASLPVPCCA